MRVLAAGVLGAAVASAAAVILGEYPLSGSVPWLAALVVPAAIGLTMTTMARRHRPALWAATGPLAAASLAWGVRIATGWGLDPVPAAAWAAIAVGLVWPLGWAAWSRARRQPAAS
jgi:hypothetical protein